MAVQTDIELTSAGTVIKDATSAGSNTATAVGTLLNNIIENKPNISKFPYKKLSIKLNGGGSPTGTVINSADFPLVTFTYALLGNGQITITASSAIFSSGKTFMQGSTLNNGGQPYFVIGSALSTSIFLIDIKLFDGTQTGTPNFSNFYVPIYIYN